MNTSTPEIQGQRLLPTTLAQKQLFALAQMNQQGQRAYNETLAIELIGPFNRAAIRTALTDLVQHRDSLRTTFNANGDQQIIHSQGELNAKYFPIENFTNKKESTNTEDETGHVINDSVKKWINEEVASEFDIINGPLHRFCIAQIAEQRHLLVMTYHHSITDGMSIELCLYEIAERYCAIVENRPVKVEPAVGFVDYIQWWEAYSESEQCQTDKSYWLKQYNTAVEPLNLPSKANRSLTRSFNANTENINVDSALIEQLKTLGKQQHCSLVMVLYASYAAFLSRLCGQEDFVVPIPSLGREFKNSEFLTGYCASFMPIRNTLQQGQTFVDYLTQTKTKFLDADEHKAYPFAYILEDLSTLKKVDRGSFGKVTFNIDNYMQQPSFTDLETHLSVVNKVYSPFDLALNIVQEKHGYQFQLHYSADLFDPADMARFAANFQVFLSSIVTDPIKMIDDFDLLTEHERHQVLVEWNDTKTPYPQDKCIHELFEEQAENNPNAVALIFKDKTLTYKQLNEKANQLAHYLIEEDVEPNTPIGIYMDRSLEMIVSMLAILKAGCAYVPLDRKVPKSRLDYIVNDSEISVILTQSNLQARKTFGDNKILNIDSLPTNNSFPIKNCLTVSKKLRSEALAYIIYTSGSTGTPKGVAISHKGVVRLVINTNYVEFNENSIMLQHSATTFDAATLEIWAPLLNGGKLIIYHGESTNVFELAESVKRHKVNILFLSVGFFSIWLDVLDQHALDLEYLITGGDVIPPNTVRGIYDINPDIIVINAYGPTENTTLSTTYVVPRSINEKYPVPIGRPISQSTCYILDRKNQPVAIGSVGELHVGGDGLAKGYINRPELNNDKFILNPFVDNRNDRLYKTGDLVRWLPDGNIEFMGRLDFQVKIRGYRIELGEIEIQLATSEHVKECTVIARADNLNNKYLVAYFIAKNQTKAIGYGPYLIELRDHLRKNLPEYMIPTAFVELKQFPINTSGKIDRKALPAPDTNAIIQEIYVAPSTETEKILCQIWQEILHVDSIGIHDSFFTLGGHSLIVIQLISRLRELFSVELPMQTIFSNTTICELAIVLDELSTSEHAIMSSITVSNKTTALPSFAQQRLWIISQLEQQQSVYNMSVVFSINGSLNIVALGKALNTVIQRHSILRTVFEDTKDQVKQTIINKPDFKLVQTDLSHLSLQEQENKISGTIDEEAVTPFDLRRDLMLRARLLKRASDDYILLISLHHIAADGASLNILFEELSQLYKAYQNEEEVPLLPLPIQYIDFSLWQRDWLQGDILQKQLTYWEEKLTGLPLTHSLPLDYSRPQKQSFKGSQYIQSIDQSTTQGLNTLAQQSGATLFMVLQAAWAILMARYSNETDIVIGFPTANRIHKQIEPLIGFFVNTLIMRANLSDDPSFNDLLAQTKRNILEAHDHQNIPFELLVEKLNPERSLSHSPLFQMMLVLQDNRVKIFDLPDVKITEVRVEQHFSKFDLILDIVETPQSLDILWEYATDIFEADTIERWAANLAVLLKGIVVQPQQSVSKLPLLTEHEQQQLLEHWNYTESAYPKDKCLHELFEEQAEKALDNIAIVFEGQQLTYTDLNAKANQVAHYLHQQGVNPDTLVGLCVERSLEMMIGLLGIIKVGGAYVPIDPGYPEERIRYLLENSEVSILLSQSHLVDDLPITQQQLLYLDIDRDKQGNTGIFSSQPTENIPKEDIQLSPTHLAYVIYTSGSTGRPKGVLIEHENVTRLFYSTQEQFHFTQDDTWTLFHSIAFDFSVWEVWGALIYGGKLVIVPKLIAQSPVDFYKLLTQQNITVLNQTPAIFERLINVDEQEKSSLALRAIIFGGEALNPLMLKPWFARHSDKLVQLVNMYGITETTVHVTYRQLYQDDGLSQRSIIGKKLADLTLYVLDENLSPVPIGAIGEMYIGGPGVARGYLNNPELTTDKFIQNPFNYNSINCLYKTGDLARWLSHGDLEYLGRIDNQVKIRGFRIELGEIEAQLAASELVQECIVLVREDNPGDKHLVAYFVHQDKIPNAEEGELLSNLRSQLKNNLPDYMVPTAFVRLDALPLTPNGKIDRKALPAPDTSAIIQEIYVAPSTATEQTLCKIWQEILNVDSIGIHDNFFALGGHSLIAIQLISRLRESFAVELPMQAIFSNTTIGELAIVLDELSTSEHAIMSSITASNQITALPSFAQQRLWIISQLEQRQAIYNMFGAFSINGSLNIEALGKAFNTVIQRHSILRTVFEDMNDQVKQTIINNPSFKLVQTELSHLSSQEQEKQISETIDEEAATPFDLRRDLMLRAKLLKRSSDDYMLLINLHHIAADGASINILFEELAQLYKTYVNNEEIPLLPLPIQYIDFSLWQRDWLQGDILQQQLTYWEEKLAALPLTHNLPLDHPRPQQQSFKGSQYIQSIDQSTTQGLNTLVRQSGATLFMLLQAAWATFMARYSNETDIAIGFPTANRIHKQIEPLIGFFVNALIMRVNLSDDPSFNDLLAQTKRNTLEAHDHQSIPFELLVEKLNPERSLSHSPLFQVMLVLQDNRVKTFNLPDAEITEIRVEQQFSKFDLTLDIAETPQGLQILWQYATDIFEASTIECWAANFAVLLKGIVAQPQQSVFKLPLLTKQEQKQVTEQWNNNPVSYPRDKCIYQLFEKQAEDKPNAIAMVYQGKSLTFSALNGKANQLAHYLIEQGVVPDTLVGICFERSFEMLVSILAIWKAGAGYVPIAPEAPMLRVKLMLEKASITLIISRSSLRKTLGINGQRILCLDESEIQVMLEQYDSNKIGNRPDSSPAHLAYAIFTSGSTGTPKGVAVNHTSLVNLGENLFRLLQKANNPQPECWAWNADYTFDASLQALSQLAYGTKIAIIPEIVRKDPEALCAFFIDQKITVFDCTPVQIKILLDIVDSHSLPTLFIGGDTIGQETWRKLIHINQEHGVLAYNVYGPTETCVDATVCPITAAYPEECLGYLLNNVIGYVVNNGSLTPIGVTGELLLGGAGVARGYLNNPELTKTQFVEDQYGNQPEARLYKTGDKARWRNDGTLECLGRMDYQVKIRGYRIELGEIESQLTTCDQVKECVVIAREDTPGDTRLVAYLQPNSMPASHNDHNDSLANIRSHLEQALPKYMIPSAFVLMDELPLTTSGKVDRVALPIPDDTAVIKQQYQAPSNEMEKTIVKLWQQLLGIEKVSVLDNFFELGGNSLKIIELAKQINTLLNTQLLTVDLFAYPSIAALCDFLTKGDDDTTGSDIRQKIVSNKKTSLQRFKKIRHGVNA